MSLEQTTRLSTQRRDNGQSRGEELECIRRRLNNKKTSGKGLLSNYVIKKLPRLFWEITRIIFNNCMANSYFSVKSKKAVIMPLSCDTKRGLAHKPPLKLGTVPRRGIAQQN